MPDSVGILPASDGMHNQTQGGKARKKETLGNSTTSRNGGMMSCKGREEVCFFGRTSEGRESGVVQRSHSNNVKEG